MATQTLELRVEGMSCEHCVATVRKALLGVAGVSAATVDLAGHRATVEYDAAAATPQALLDAVTDAGYEPSLLA